MSGTRLIAIVAQVLLGLVLFATASPPALADTTTLICHMDMDFFIEDDVTTIELDQAASTVVIHWGGYHSRDNVVRDLPHTNGPYHTEYGKDTITFHNNYITEDGYASYSINRLTGTFLEQILSDTLTPQGAPYKWNCHVAKPQF
jgi:hypothetical protein